jgi:hypothetical protein
MSKYLIQISPDPFDFIVVDEELVDQASKGAYYVGKQLPVSVDEELVELVATL